MLERTPRHREIQMNFRSLAEKILAREGAIIVENAWKTKNGKTPPTAPDFVFKRPPENELTVVEAKLLRSRRLEDALFRNALEEVKRYRDARKAKHGILILTADLTELQAQEAERQGVTLWGISQLVPLALKTPTLAEALSDLLREVSSDGEQFAEIMQQLEANTARSKARGDGAKLVAEFDQIKPGREGQRRFEQVGEKAMRLLLSDQVQRWSVPVITEDGMSRPALVVRLMPRHDVWSTLCADLGSRYMTIGFLNQPDAAGHGDILSAARHLYPRATRSIALVLARAGWDGAWRRAAIELLREQGKLVLPVGLQDLKDMLIARDSGDEYHDFFHERASDLMADNLV
jgi:hypothetical protein